MCGILGTVSLSGTLHADQAALRRALDLQAHRGPDNGAILLGRAFAFGHRRLSIIDLSHESDQPMQSADGRLSIVFNGEIYNYRELRAALEARGRRFQTQGDTEVILQSFEEFGPDCIHAFIGMFAFALHDARQGETFLFRDRLGVKPLYYREGGDTLTFASEPKSILAYDRLIPRLNRVAVSSYLSFRYPILDDSFFEGIRSLPPGHYLQLAEGKARLHRFWNPVDRFYEQDDDRGEAYYIGRLRELLASSVRYRMIADVPSGAFLSGGVDSSVLTALMALASPKPVKTFTIGFAESGFNEFAHAGLVARRYGTDHKEIELSGSDYMDTMARLIRFKDAPLSVPNEVPLYLMSKELKKDITVVISGEGADELFGGYGRIFRSTDDFVRSQPKHLAGLSADDRMTFVSRFELKYGTQVFGSELDHFLAIYRYTSASQQAAILHDDMDAAGADRRLKGQLQAVFDEIGTGSYFDKMSWAFVRVHLPGLLGRLDATTMAASVEGRVPFLDHRLVEFACTVPRHYKLRWNSERDRMAAGLLMSDQISETHDTPKYLLKKAFEPELPAEILYRRKMGFPVPLSQWLGRDFLPHAREILLTPAAAERHIFDLPAVERLLTQEQLENDHGLAQRVWMMMNIETFCQEYIGKPLA